MGSKRLTVSRHHKTARPAYSSIIIYKCLLPLTGSYYFLVRLTITYHYLQLPIYDLLPLTAAQYYVALLATIYLLLLLLLPTTTYDDLLPPLDYLLLSAPLLPPV